MAHSTSLNWVAGFWSNSLRLQEWASVPNPTRIHFYLHFLWQLVLQDFLSHATDGLFTQGGFNDRTQDLSTQNHYGLGGFSSQVRSGLYTLHFSNYTALLMQNQSVLSFKLAKNPDVIVFFFLFCVQEMDVWHAEYGLYFINWESPSWTTREMKIYNSLAINWIEKWII